jgi:hypothetical protein
VQYGSGVPSPAVAAQQAQNDPKTAAAVMQAHPFEVEQIAMRFRVPRATAAMMLLAQMQGQPMPAMAQGGYADAGSPVGQENCEADIEAETVTRSKRR